MKAGTHNSPNKRESNQPVARTMHAQRSPTNSQAVGPQTVSLDDEQRHRMIEVAAYIIAERHGFCQGTELDDWLAAEAEVESRSGRSNV